jgi:CheY-like chemotaxis protein
MAQISQMLRKLPSEESYNALRAGATAPAVVPTFPAALPHPRTWQSHEADFASFGFAQDRLRLEPPRERAPAVRRRTGTFPAVEVSRMQNRRILIIDDNPVVSQLLRTFLEDAGYLALDETRALRALQTARKFAPDLVLLDFHMPVLDGCAVASRFAADDDLKTTPIVFLTGSPIELLARGRTADFPLLAKPVSLQALLDCVREHLPQTAPRFASSRPDR